MKMQHRSLSREKKKERSSPSVKSFPIPPNAALAESVRTGVAMLSRKGEGREKKENRRANCRCGSFRFVTFRASPERIVPLRSDVSEGSLAEVSPPSYPGGYPPGHWVTPGPTPSIEELCHKFTGRPTELRLPSRSTLASLQSMPMTGGAVMGGGGQGGVVPLGGGQGVVVAGECLDGEAIKRRLMANRLPESCV